VEESKYSENNDMNGEEAPLATRRERREITSTSWMTRLDDLHAEEAIKRK